MRKYFCQISSSFLFIVLLITGGACSTGYKNPNLPQLSTQEDYYQNVDKYSDRNQQYEGFNQILEMSGTLINTAVAMSQLDSNARIYQWTQEQYSTKKIETEHKLANRTEIFLSFFVPDRKHDDLHKAATLWKIFLDVGGKRYEGQAEKIKTILAEIQTMYPHHTRFHTPYRLIFQVPTAVAESSEAKLTLTGPVVSSSLTFPALKHP